MPKTVSLYGGSHYVRWNNGEQDWHDIPITLFNLLDGRSRSHPHLPGPEIVSLGPHDSWFVKFEDGRIRFDNLSTLLEEIIVGCDDITSVALGPNDSFVVVDNYRRIFSKNIPASLVDKLKNNKRGIKQICFGAYSHWSIVYEDGTALYTNSDYDDFTKTLNQKEFICMDPEYHDFYCIIGAINKCFFNASQEFEAELLLKYPFRVPIDKVYFLQDSINHEFKNGFSIYDLAKQIANDEVDVKSIPTIRVVREGDIYWSLDNRRLWAFKAAGLKSIPVEVVSPNIHYYRLRDQGRGGPTVQIRSLVS